MCRDYGLPISGNKTQLKARLQQFSEKFCNDPPSWCVLRDISHNYLTCKIFLSNLTPVKRRSHKGPQAGPKKAQPKLSATRRAAIIDTERVTERSKDTRTADETKELLRWVRVLLNRHLQSVIFF